MPYVNVRLTECGATKEQKSRIVEEITQTLSTVLDKNPAVTHVVIVEIDPDNWGYGGKLVSEIRKQAAGK